MVNQLISNHFDVVNVSILIATFNNIGVLADRMIQLGSDKELRQKLSIAARKRVEERFTVEENVRSTEQVYRELTEEVVRWSEGVR